jgi:protein tyrosine phosphatase type 4A
MEFNATLIEVPLRDSVKRYISTEPAASDVGAAAAAERQITLRLMILDAPAPSNLAPYIAALQRYGVKHLVRVCAQRYRSDVVEMANIATHAWPFDDGAPPPQAVLDEWLGLLDSEVREVGPDGRCPLVAVHCVAGLGRAPILVAVALVEYGNFAPLDAVSYIRERRRGAINQVQLDWLMNYTARKDRAGSWWTMCCQGQ